MRRGTHVPFLSINALILPHNMIFLPSSEGRSYFINMLVSIFPDCFLLYVGSDLVISTYARCMPQGMSRGLITGTCVHEPHPRLAKLLCKGVKYLGVSKDNWTRKLLEL